MPTYQYTCTECGTPLEVVQSFSDAALTTCPTCGGRLRKVFSAVGVVFKGSGFYRNDSRDNGKAKPGKVTAESGATSGSDSTAKSDAGADKKSTDSTKSDTSTSTTSTPAAGSNGAAKPAETPKKSSSAPSSGSSAA